VWGTVVLMAAVTAVDPKRIGVVAVMLSRPRTMRLLLAYFIGGFGVSLIAGAVSLFVLEGAGIETKNSVPPGSRSRWARSRCWPLCSSAADSQSGCVTGCSRDTRRPPSWTRHLSQPGGPA